MKKSLNSFVIYYKEKWEWKNSLDKYSKYNSSSNNNRRNNIAISIIFNGRIYRKLIIWLYAYRLLLVLFGLVFVEFDDESTRYQEKWTQLNFASTHIFNFWTIKNDGLNSKLTSTIKGKNEHWIVYQIIS